MTVAVHEIVLNLAVAAGLGAVIGCERQWHHRLAGLQTNTLVALGAASFATFAALIPNPNNPTQMAGQVVSGIGFLGAGVIFKEGLSVRGLNTAATLWCSASVGLLAGDGYGLTAALVALLVLGVNMALHPLVLAINALSAAQAVVPTRYRITVLCVPAAEATVRARLLDVAGPAMPCAAIGSATVAGSEHVEVRATFVAEGAGEHAVETAAAALRGLPGVAAARWQTAPHDAP